MEPLPGGVPTIAGRTPIACQNCANAKTGCDKRVPCSRCAEKNLTCAARFARRSSKAAVRLAQANAALQTAMMQTAQQVTPSQIHPSFLEVDQNAIKTDSTKSPQAMDGAAPRDSVTEGSPKKALLHQSQSPDAFSPSPHARVHEGNLDEFMQMGNDFGMQETVTYQDLMMWPDFSMELDMYPGTIPLMRTDVSMPAFPEFSDTSSSESMGTASSRSSIHTRGTSIMSTGDFDTSIKPSEFAMAALSDESIPEFEVVLAAEASWNFARCNPPSSAGSCPRTAIVHLECLEQKSKHEGTWSSLEKYLEQVEWDPSDVASVVPLTPRTRDKMLAITQSFLHKALDIHRGSLSNGGYPKASSPGDFSFLVLPPNNILEYFLRSYVRSLSVYYPLVTTCVDPNEMLQNNQASTLLFLLMIAQGAAAMPIAEARYLSAGLTETCRISLFDIVEKDIELASDPTTLRCALLFIVLGAWSGDKWLMDIAMGQRGMYMSVSSHYVAG